MYCMHRELRVRHLARDEESGTDAEAAGHRDLALREEVLRLHAGEPREAHDHALRPDALRLPSVPGPVRGYST